jgi:uncharacterized protein (TIGR02687 family)
MRLPEIEEQLTAIFSSHPKRGHRRHVVFWYDDHGEFADDVPKLNLGDVKIITLTGRNNYLVKRTLEIDDPDSNYLIYSPGPRPKSEDNWLLDIELYSERFTADRLDIIMRQLGIDNPALRPVIEKHRRFFSSKERIERFKALGIAEYSERSIEIGIMAVLTKQRAADVNAIFKALLSEDIIDDVAKVVGIELIHKYARSDYGYSLPEFDLERFRIMLFLSAFAHQAQVELPETWKDMISHRRANCYILVNDLGQQPEYSDAYNCMADRIADAVNLSKYLRDWDPWIYASSGIFRQFDVALTERIVEGLVQQVDTFDYWLELMEKRRTTRWYRFYKDIYQALEQAIAVVRLKEAWGEGFAKGTARDLFKLYIDQYYQMDQAYRKFYAAYDKAKTPELLKGVRTRIEGIYANWFLQELGMKWSDRIKAELSEWERIDRDIDQQHQFFDSIKSHLMRDGRVFVIIADGLRYEAGVELAERLQSEFSGDTKIEAMQGVLPSVTSIGMAALLPHKTLAIGAKGVFVNGEAAEGLLRREVLLRESGYEARAILLKDVLGMTTDEMRSALEGVRLVYIYQDRIDDTGHHRNEQEVFQAVEDTIGEIVDGVRALRNKVSATNIYITADHGFIYTRDPLGESDKLPAVVESGIERRYALTDGPVADPNVISIKLRHPSQERGDLYLIAPRGYIRFKKQGPGLNFVHGGPSLQEIVLPKIRHWNDKAGKRPTAKVNLELRASAYRITNRVFTLEFLQEHPVGDNWLPRTVIAKFVDAEGQPVSDQAVIIADRISKDRNERLFRVRFTLSSAHFDKNADYFLVLEDPDERVEKVLAKYKFQIDLIPFGFDL